MNTYFCLSLFFIFIKTNHSIIRRVNYYNGKWREFGGVGLVEGEVMGWWPLVHPNDLDACKKHFERSYRKCRGFELECRYSKTLKLSIKIIILLMCK